MLVPGSPKPLLQTRPQVSSFEGCTTMASFQVSIRALSGSIPYAKEYYLEGKKGALDEHLKTFWCRAVDWCTWIASVLFVAGLVCTIVFVSVNVWEVKHMNNEEAPKVVTSNLKTIKPPAMTPLTEGAKPPAMTPMSSGGENRGIKPAPMTQIPTPAPAQPAGNTPAQPAQSPKK